MKWVGILVGLILCGLAGYALVKSTTGKPARADGGNVSQPLIHNGKVIPPEGVFANPLAQNLGNPENAEKDFRRIYQWIVEYREKHNRLPEERELRTLKEASVPGGIVLTKEDWSNPDAKFANYAPRLEDHAYSPTFSERSDGTPKPAWPKKGERDIWMWCDIYTRTNERLFPDGGISYHYNGVVVVLWSDGKIERVKYGDMMLSPTEDNRWIHTIKGAAGISPKAIAQRDWVKSGKKYRYTFE